MIVTDPKFLRAQQEAVRLAQLKPGEPGVVRVKRMGDYIIYSPDQLPGLWRALRVRDLTRSGLTPKQAMAKSRRELKYKPWLLTEHACG